MKKFISYWLLSLFLIITISFSVNIIVDPYHIFNILEIKGINKNKPFQSGWEQITKPAHLFREQPKHIILGSSVSQSGFHTSIIENKLGLKSYNMGIDGPTIFEIYKLLKFSIDNSQINSGILSLELMMFNGARGLHNSRFNKRRMNSVLSQRKLDFLSFKEIYKLTIAYNTLKDSVKTLMNQNTPSYYSDDGSIYLQLELKNMELSFQRSNKAYINFMLNNFHGLDYFITNNGVNLIDVFSDLLSLSYRNGIKLNLIFSPMHQYFKNSILENDLYYTYVLWKKIIKQKNIEIAKIYSMEPYALFDFSEHPMTNEEIPQGKTQKMKYWVDAYHFSFEFGDLILSEIYKD